MRESFASDRTQIHLGPGRQVNRPKLASAGRLGRADEFVGCAAQEIATRLILQCPTTAAILADADLKATARIALLALTQHITKLIDR